MGWFDWFTDMFASKDDRPGTWEIAPEASAATTAQPAPDASGPVTAPAPTRRPGAAGGDAAPLTAPAPSQRPDRGGASVEPGAPVTAPPPTPRPRPDIDGGPAPVTAPAPTPRPGRGPVMAEKPSPRPGREMAEGPSPRPQMQIGWALTQEDVENTANFLGVTPAHVWAVVSVETRGYGFFADRTPAILFERHYFSRLTGGVFDSSHPDISNPKFGGYGASSQQYDRLARAAGLNYDAALKSASWGIGQVMGSNAENLDYSSVREFVALARKSEGEQLTAMARFIDRNGLKRPMQRRDWTFFARRYNGPSFAKNKYDTRLEAAYQLYSTPGRMPDWKVRQAQVYLVYFGELDARGVDGIIGRKTRSALNDFFDSIGRTDIDTSGLGTVSDELLAILSNRAGQLPDRWPLTEPGGGGGVGMV